MNAYAQRVEARFARPAARTDHARLHGDGEGSSEMRGRDRSTPQVLEPAVEPYALPRIVRVVPREGRAAERRDDALRHDARTAGAAIDVDEDALDHRGRRNGGAGETSEDERGAVSIVLRE